MKQELLAPAGDIEAGYAALYYGADAVYLGLKRFSARATAANFDEEELNNFTGYAHSLQRKVYVTINTLIQEHELPELIHNLDICANCGVDGIILQDIGVARVIKKVYPELELHASTQMAVHNKEGALALQELGFKRVVLARELSLSEIKEISAIKGLETEAFIHGALCYSYSGLCMFSSLESGRSANRGKCLYPCRAAFNGNKHLFSMKDMALGNDVLKMPVTSLKIEGRKKNALYVAAVTDYYRNILDGKGAQLQKEENIKQIFSRPWCKFMLHGKNKNVVDRDFVGHRGLPIGRVGQVQKNWLNFKTERRIARHDGLQIDVAGEEKPFGFSVQNMRVGGKNVFEAQAGENVAIQLPFKTDKITNGQVIYLASSSEVKGGYDYIKPKSGEYIKRYDVEVKIDVAENKIKASANGAAFEITGEFAPADDVSKTDEAAFKAFAKTGDTLLQLRNLQVSNPQKLFVPASKFNELRRGLYAQIEVCGKQGRLPDIPSPRTKSNTGWILRVDNLKTLAEISLDDVTEIEIMLNPEMETSYLRDMPKSKIRLVLPAVARNVAKWSECINKFLSAGYKKWTIGNWWGLSVLPSSGVDIAFDNSLYVLNSQASAMASEIGASRITLSVEDTLENLQAIAGKSSLAVVMPVYTDVPLFTSAVCIRDNACGECSRGRKWIKINRDGKIFYALSHNCQTFLFADFPLCWTAEASSVPADFYRVDFCYKEYSPKQAAAIWNKIREFKDIPDIMKGNIGSNRF